MGYEVFLMWINIKSYILIAYIKHNYIGELDYAGIMIQEHGGENWLGKAKIQRKNQRH